jgi:hypothetical protein
MKLMTLISIFLFQVSAYANEVINYNGQKLVLIKIETAEKLDRVISRPFQGVNIQSQISAILRSELLVTPEQENFCSTAAKVYNPRGQSSQNFAAKCERALTSRDLIEELATDAPEYQSAQELRQMVSVYLAFLLLM